jgi:hypothetical protein
MPVSAWLKPWWFPHLKYPSGLLMNLAKPIVERAASAALVIKKGL